MTDIVQQYVELHKAGHFAGLSVLGHKEKIKALILSTGAKTLLDYGSGKGRQYSEHGLHHYWGILPDMYDPAVPGLDAEPSGIYDGVICSDVLEHLEEHEIQPFMDRVYSHAGKFLFLTVCCRPAKKTLPDGRNCHLTVRPVDWWREQVLPGRPLAVLEETP